MISANLEWEKVLERGFPYKYIRREFKRDEVPLFKIFPLLRGRG